THQSRAPRPYSHGQFFRIGPTVSSTQSQAAAAAGRAHCASVFCQAGNARKVPYQRLISRYGSPRVRPTSARLCGAPSEKSATVSLSPTTNFLLLSRPSKTRATRWNDSVALAIADASGSPLLSTTDLTTFSNKNTAQVGSQCARSQNCQRVTSSRPFSSDGSRPLSGRLLARYCMMAFDSHST